MENERKHQSVATRRAINKTNALLNGGDFDFTNIKEHDSGFYPFYTATNENLEYFADLHVDGKDTLTVTGSGDHALNLAFFGAKSISTFDINQMTFIAFNLKKNAILHLTRNEFIEFYTPPKMFNKKLYMKIAPYLNPTTRAVFDVIVSKVNAYELCVVDYCQNEKNLLINNPYMYSEETYKEMKRRLQNLTSPIIHRACPVNKLNKVFGPKDVVILSNILHYCLYNMYDNSDFNMGDKKRCDEFLKSLKGTLNKGGVASLLYLYYANDTISKKSLKHKLGIKFETIDLENSLKKSQVVLVKEEDLPELD